MQKKIRLIARTGLCVALAVLFGYVESLFPMPVPVPGVKLGLANIVVLCLLLRGETLQAALVAFIRVALSAVVFSGFSGFVYALSGSLVSYGVMFLALKLPRLGTVGVSVLGAAAHTMAQLTVAIAVTRTAGLMAYAPILLVSSVATGILTGVAAGSVVRLLPKFMGK